MNFETLKNWLKLGKELGFRVLREDCRHCKGTGICHSGMSEAYGISCASCQKSILGEISTKAVKCDICGGRGVFVYTVPGNDSLARITLEVLPAEDEGESLIRVHSTQDRVAPDEMKRLPHHP